MNYRDRRLLDAVRELPCTWPLPHLCESGHEGPCEPAHSNQQRDGKGTSIKAHDYRVAALCHRAHEICDQGKHLTKEQRREAWDEAHRKTMGLLFERGIVRVR